MTETLDTAQYTACPQCGAPVDLPEYADLAVCPYCGSGLRRTTARAPGRPDAPGLGGPTEQVLQSLSCPQCAGPLSVRAGRRILLCPHCGIRTLVRGGGGVSRWLFPQSVEKLQAVTAAAKWLSDYPGISRRAREVSVTQGRLVYVPIWEHRALVAGWEFGTKLRTSYHLVATEDGNERLDLALTEEPVEEPHLVERRLFKAACTLETLGATRPRFSGRELLLPLIAGEIDPSSTVIEPQGTATEISEQGRRTALQPTAGAADPETRMLVLRESTALLYYPLWLVDYRVGERSHRIVVDGRDASINSATAPAGDRWSAGHLGVRIAALMALAVFAAWLASVWDGGRVPSALAAVIVVMAAIVLALRSPGGGKVEYHEPFSS
jgi:DNA-directed RNA polymerase subunit RPC12/RpoP